MFFLNLKMVLITDFTVHLLMRHHMLNEGGSLSSLVNIHTAVKTAACPRRYSDK